jgi:hypothetical protein
MFDNVRTERLALFDAVYKLIRRKSIPFEI